MAVQPREVSTFDLVKRILVGRRVATSRLEHTLLPKVLALPVFSSDALSSVAYATEEILRVLLLASAAAATFVMPISFAIAALLVIVVVSYRQTVRAYPSGGGAYIVSKDNLGTFPGLVAAAALLTDYVLTVSVSVVAGVFAITSAVPSLNGHKVLLSVGFVILITLANLRGVKESGTVFAVPTYGFILAIFLTVLTGLARCVLSACPRAVLPADHMALGSATASVGLFVILHAFSSGSTALTGVEAISNGVPAFRRPQSKNAAATLGMMGVVAVSMFLGISFLAFRAHPIPSDTKSVVAQIADGVFHGGVLYYLVQVFTAAILILAANTSYQDFPRLSSILARDRFLPTQFENRGDRLVFSNGVIVLALFASILIYAFHADLGELIQLYVVGVFTSFTLSQSGMVRHWLKIRRAGGEAAKGWRRSIVINGVGAIATFVVLIVVVATKFGRPPRPGAWIVIAAIPVIVAGFYAIHDHYAAVRRMLRSRVAPLSETPVNRVVLYVEDLDPATVEALGYVRGFCGRTGFHAVHVGRGPAATNLAARWRAFSRTDVELEILPGSNVAREVIRYVHGITRDPGDFVTVVIPETLARRSLLAAIRSRSTFLLKLRLLSEPQIVITDVPVVTTDRQVKLAPVMPLRTTALVFVSGVNDATQRAANYARSLQATETRAVYFALDPGEIGQVMREWEERGIPMELDIVEAPFRDLGPPMLEEVRRVTDHPVSIAAVIIPEIIPKKWWHGILHRQRPLYIKRLLLFEPRVILSSVPYHLR
ncbi:MAG TPA: APC family permease [Actinomycetota bacterium]